MTIRIMCGYLQNLLSDAIKNIRQRKAYHGSDCTSDDVQTFGDDVKWLLLASAHLFDHYRG